MKRWPVAYWKALVALLPEYRFVIPGKRGNVTDRGRQPQHPGGVAPAAGKIFRTGADPPHRRKARAAESARSSPARR